MTLAHSLEWGKLALNGHLTSGWFILPHQGYKQSYRAVQGMIMIIKDSARRTGATSTSSRASEALAETRVRAPGPGASS